MNSGEPRPLAYQPNWLIGWGMLAYEKDRNPGARKFYAACCAEWAERQRIAKLAAELQAQADKITKG